MYTYFWLSLYVSQITHKIDSLGCRLKFEVNKTVILVIILTNVTCVTPI